MNAKASSAVNLRTPSQKLVSINGAELHYFEWPGAGAPILMAHGTGFHARCWDAVVSLLGDARVIAVEHRGHGRSSKTPPYDWGTLGADMAGVVEALDLREVTGVGHSLGAHVMIQAAFAHTERFRNLLAIDPILCAPEDYARAKPFAGVHPASKRRNVWASPDAMYDSFKVRVPFSRWKPSVFGIIAIMGCGPPQPLVKQGMISVWRVQRRSKRRCIAAPGKATSQTKPLRLIYP